MRKPRTPNAHDSAGHFSISIRDEAARLEAPAMQNRPESRYAGFFSVRCPGQFSAAGVDAFDHGVAQHAEQEILSRRLSGDLFEARAGTFETANRL
jgi:hypothetical protein